MMVASMPMPSLDDIRAARERIDPYVVTTPVLAWREPASPPRPVSRLRPEARVPAAHRQLQGARGAQQPARSTLGAERAAPAWWR
jgi:hypothetical protein